MLHDGQVACRWRGRPTRDLLYAATLERQPSTRTARGKKNAPGNHELLLPTVVLTNNKKGPNPRGSSAQGSTCGVEAKNDVTFSLKSTKALLLTSLGNFLEVYAPLHAQKTDSVVK